MDSQPFDRRGLFDGLRVPLDLNMFVLALAWVTGFHWIVKFLEWFMDTEDLLLRTVAELGLWGGVGGERLSPAAWFLTVVVGLAFWSFFASAIARIGAMKLAREETLGVKEACRFAFTKFLSTLASVLFVGTIFIIFYVIVNASIFGAIGRIPYAGELIVALAYPLILLVTFLVVFSCLLGLFGFNLAASAIATESSDTWDGISRSWNYVLVRPWTVLLVLGLTFVYITVFSLAGSRFMSWSVESLAIGGWGMGNETYLEVKKGEALPLDLRDRNFAAVYGVTYSEVEAKSEAEAKEWSERKKKFDATDFWVALPGKVEFLRGYASGRYDWDRVVYMPSTAKPELERLAEEYGDDGFHASTSLANRGGNVAGMLPWTLKLSGFVIWLWRWVCIYLMAAFALTYFLGANTMLYFLLRREVEGEDYSEIVVEDEDFDDDWSYAEPVATKGAPGALIMPARGIGGAPAPLPDKPAEAKAETPAEAKTEKPAEAKAEKPAEAKTEKPAEAKAEKAPLAEDDAPAAPKREDAKPEDAKPEDAKPEPSDAAPEGSGEKD